MTLGLEPRLIAEQMGWKLKGTLELLEVYGHGNIGALDEIDVAFRRGQLRAISDARQTQTPPQGA